MAQLGALIEVVRATASLSVPRCRRARSSASTLLPKPTPEQPQTPNRITDTPREAFRVDPETLFRRR